MKNNKKLFLSVALLTTLAFSGALVSCDSDVPLIPKDIPTLYKADEVVEGETENTEPIPPSENVEETPSEIVDETPSGEEEINPSEEETLQQKIEELEAMLKAQTDELWSKELVSGLTIGGAVLFAMELLMTIFKSRVNKKKDAEYKDNFIALENKYTELVSCYEKAKVETDKFLETACNEMNSMKNECVSILKSLNEIIPELKNYEQFNQRLITVINILDTLSFTPENVKNGVAEQVKKLIEEVK